MYKREELETFVNREKRVVAVKLTNVAKYLAHDYMKTIELSVSGLSDVAFKALLLNYLETRIYSIMLRQGLGYSDSLTARAKCHETDSFDEKTGAMVARRKLYRRYLRARILVYKRLSRELEAQLGRLSAQLARDSLREKNIKI